MRLFNFLKKKTDTKWIEKTAAAVNSTVAENEKKYYQDDSYYTSKVHEGTVFERPVITFEERKKPLYLLKEDYTQLKFCCLNIVLMVYIQIQKTDIQDFGGLSMASAMLVLR